MTIVWEKKYNVNVQEIDEQYTQLVQSFNRLVKLVKRHGAASEISEIINNLIGQSKSCFQTEEMYFHKLGFDKSGEYRQGHITCLSQIELFRRNYDPEKPLVNFSHIDAITKAFIGHIAICHTEFNEYRKENRIRSFIKAHA